MALPLEGIKILDLSRMAPGPYGTMVLADLGADVLRVEEVGLAGRRAAIKGAEKGAEWLSRTEVDCAYDAVGRNKRSIALNLKNEEARQIFYRLAETADVLIEEFRPGVVRRLGVDYDTIKKINPGIIYCSVTGYGQTGPYKDTVGHDLNYISIAGAQSTIGTTDGKHAIPQNYLADYAGGGMVVAIAVLSALVGRRATGEGQYVDVCMTDGVIYLMASLFSDFFQKGKLEELGRSRFGGGDPRYSIYQAKDGKYISISSLEPWFWDALCKAMGLDRLAEYSSRGDHDELVRAGLEERFCTKTRDEWFEILTQVDSCVGKVHTLDEVASDPQVRAREMIMEMEHPRVGRVRQVGIPFKFQGETPGLRSFAPLHGQHTEEVLTGLGYSSTEIARLRGQGAAK